jgi:hypothetical protein
MVNLKTHMNNKGYKDTSTNQLLLGIAVLALGQALQVNYGFFSVPAIGWLTITLICTVFSTFSNKLHLPKIPGKVIAFILGSGLVFQIYLLTITLPGYFLLSDFLKKLSFFKICVITAGLFALLSLIPVGIFKSWIRKSFFACTILSMGAAGIWLVNASPKPFIDVFVFEQTSAQALLKARNPYELKPPNIYGNMDFYGPLLVKDGKMTIGNPYPPLSIYLSTIGYAVAGDIRYSHLVAILLSAILIASLGFSSTSLLSAYTFLFTPRVFFVLEQSWTEPLVILVAVFVVWCSFRRPKWTMLVFGLMMAVKQYMIFFFPLVVLLIPRSSPRKVWITAASWIGFTAFAVTAPLLFWNFSAFLWDVGLAQWDQVFRITSLSYAALIARITGSPPTQLLPFIIIFPLMAILIWKSTRRLPAYFALALTLCLAMFFSFSKQAFANYYFLVIGLLSCALAAFSFQTNKSNPFDDLPATISAQRR